MNVTRNFEEDGGTEEWIPKTTIGNQVKNGEIKDMHEFMQMSAPLYETNIVDKLLPGLGEEIIDVCRVQRVTDSGRRMRFRIVVGVGNRDGYVGVGIAKGKEAGPTIRMAVKQAKLNIKEIKRGCGSWECGCGNPHSVPFKVTGKCGSVKVELFPAPRGTGLVSGEIARKILALAGISDVWVHTKGHTRTAINFAFAVLDALNNTNRMKIDDEDVRNLNIISKACGGGVKKEEKEEGKEKVKDNRNNDQEKDK